jgi:hypothetical protein
VKVAVKESGYDRSEGGCQAYNIEVPDYPPVDSPVAALSLLKVKGQMKPTDTSIGGSKVEDLMPVKFSAPGLDSLSHTVRVQWHLYRFD